MKKKKPKFKFAPNYVDLDETAEQMAKDLQGTVEAFAERIVDEIREKMEEDIEARMEFTPVPNEVSAKELIAHMVRNQEADDIIHVLLKNALSDLESDRRIKYEAEIED